MRLAIRHETIYRYSHPVTYTIQILRLTPRLDAGQRVLDWAIESPGRRTRHVDAYGNVAHTLVLDNAHDSLRVAVRGTVEIEPMIDGQLPAANHDRVDPLPREMFLMPTRLTAADDAVRDFAAQVVPHGVRTPHDALKLAQAICDRVDYQSGFTDVASAASQALALGRGVCQDHAHLFLAVCRAHLVPARYVSGYVHPGDTAHVASHAWADVWFAQIGWVSIDITNATFTSQVHCRIAIGRDYESASPTRGLRTGGGDEKMDVHVSVGFADPSVRLPAGQ
jgi:transglutaminase-like putative cysteine protease